VKSHSEKERRKANQAKPDQTGPTYLQKKGRAPSSSWPQLDWAVVSKKNASMHAAAGKNRRETKRSQSNIKCRG